MVVSGSLQPQEELLSLGLLLSLADLVVEELNPVGVVGKVKLGRDDFSCEVDDHGRVVGFGHVNRDIEDLSRGTAGQHLFEIAYVVLETRSHAESPSGGMDEGCGEHLLTGPWQKCDC